MRLQDKTAIVTGAASGFGAGIARKFAAEGARVMIADLNGDGAALLATELDGVAQQVDVANRDSVAAMAAAATAAFGGAPDIIVNNAGVTHLPTPLDEVTEDDFDRVLAVNCKSVYLTARAAVPKMNATVGADGFGSLLPVALSLGFESAAGLRLGASLVVALLPSGRFRRIPTATASRQ